MNMQHSQDPKSSPQNSSPPQFASQGQMSEHALSNQLRELAEEQEGKSALITENPQRTLENASRTEQQQTNNTFLANSELIAVPVQQFLQQQPLRLSTPPPNNRQPNIIQGYTGVSQQVSHIPNGNLRSSLPASVQSSAVTSLVVNQGQGQQFSGWINQPMTTQARMQTNNREFPVQSPPPQMYPRGQMNTLNVVTTSQVRPSSSSPQRITFNYTPSQKNINLNPQPQPQPQPQLQPQQPPQPRPQPIPQPQPQLQPQQPPQPRPQPQPQPQQQQQQQQQVQPIPQPQPQPQTIIIPPKPQPTVVPVQPQPTIIHPLPPQQPRPIDNTQFILPQQSQQVIFWQQRYFILVQKFQYYYTRIEIIHKKCIYLNQAISETKKTEELTLLRAEADELLSLITATEQELTETIYRNREILADATNWRQKYEQLAKAFEALKQLHAATTQELTGKIQVLSQQLNQMENNYQAAVRKGEDEAARSHRLEEEILQLSNQLKNIGEKPNDHYQEYQLQIKEMTRVIEQKNQIILSLKQALSEKPEIHPQTPQTSPSPVDVFQKEIHRLESQLAASTKENASLRQEITTLKESYETTVRTYKETIQKYEREIIDRQSIISNYEIEIKKYITVIQSKNTEISNIIKQPSSQPSIPTDSSSRSGGELEIENRRLKHELSLYEESHNSDIKIFNGKIQQLLDKIKMISNERDASVGNLQQKATLLESDINRKDGTIRNLRDRILELEEEKKIKDLDRKYESRRDDTVASQQLSQQVANLRRELSDKNNDIQELQAQLTEYKRITNEYEDSLRVKKHEINTLKRQIEEKAQGASDPSHLNEQLVKKNAQINELRNKLVEQERIVNQNEVLRQENTHLSESLRKKHTELTETVDKAYFLEKQLRELEAASSGAAKAQSLAQELQLVQAANNRKDQEIIKLRQSNQLLQTNCDQLQLELQRLKGRLTAGERNSESQRAELKAKVGALELKIVELERKVAGLEEVRAIMTEQVNTLTAQIHIKYENQQRLEVELKQERARSKAFEGEIQAQLLETEQARVKVRQWERKYQTLSKELEAELQRKKDLSNTKKNEMFNLNNRYLQLESTLKARDARIKELQKTNDSLSTKIRTFDHNLEEIQYLKHKIAEYQHKISFQTYKFAPRLPDLQPTQVFERKVIYQLKIENEALRRQLGLLPNTDTKDIPERDTNNAHVNQRLSDFNKKLEEVISEHQLVDYNLTGDELYRRMERDRRLLIERHNEEIAQLKMRILQLEGHTAPTLPKKYTNINQIFNEQLDFYREKNLELEQRVQSHIKVNRELKESIEILLKTHSGQSSLAYYREQLDKANDTIVNLQKQLKKGSEELKKLKEDASKANSRQQAESNAAESESKVVDLTRRLNQLTLEISLLQKDRVAKEEAIGKGEAEAKRLKGALEELRLSRQELQRAMKEKEISYQDELAKLTNKLRINQMEIQRLNEIMGKRQELESSESKSLKIRVGELQEDNKRLKARVEELIIGEEKYQRQMTKLENKIQVLSAETQRLKEIADGAGKRNRDGDAELQTLRVTINEYQVKIKSFESLREGFTYRENQLQQEVVRQTNQVKLLQSEIERLTEFTQKKLSQKDTEIARIKALLNEKLDYSSQLEDQIRELKVLSFKSSETAQQIFTLKEEINSLRVTLNLKITESQNRLKEVHELNDRLKFSEEQSLQIKRTGEAKIVELQGLINSLQVQLSEARRFKDSSAENSSRAQALEQQLRLLRLQKDQDISLLRTQIQETRSAHKIQISQFSQTIFTLRRQVQQLTSANLALRQQVQQLISSSQSITEKYRLISLQYQQITVQLRRSEETITQLRIQIASLLQQLSIANSKQGLSSASLLAGSKYSVEYLRSILIQIEVLLNEQGTVRYEVLQRVEKQVKSGLEECRRWNQNFSE